VPCLGGIRRHEGGVALDGHAVRVLDGAEAVGDSCFAGGYDLAVAATVGAFGQALAESFDLSSRYDSGIGREGDIGSPRVAVRRATRAHARRSRRTGSSLGCFRLAPREGAFQRDFLRS
jgi:hypothetical protein